MQSDFQNTATATPPYVIITPVRNEEATLPRTIESVASQTVLPSEWVIVDDGSTDNTKTILREIPKNFPWIQIIGLPDRGHRKPGAGVMEAFHHGFRSLRQKDWEFLAKLDADLSFEPDYFQRCLEHFLREPALGIAGGRVYRRSKDGIAVDSPNDPPFHVRGAVKIYRRKCWEAIQPLPQLPGWDTIDEVRANYLGWKTRTFNELTVIQEKPTGSADGAIRNWIKNGQANYFTGYHPLFMFCKTLARVPRPPILVGAICLLLGYFLAAVRRLPHALDRHTVRYFRQQQLNYLLCRESIYRGG
ncbi:MAG: glycosyltransferase family A protein [Acidobacteriota bacterium]